MKALPQYLRRNSNNPAAGYRRSEHPLRVCRSLSNKVAFAMAALGLGAALGESQALAATATTWTGTSNTTFNNAANWSNGIGTSSSNSSGYLATFSGAVTANQPRVASSQGIYGIAMSTSTGGWTMSSPTGVTLTTGGGGLNTNGQSSGTNTINVETVNLGLNQTWSVGTGGSLVVNSLITNTTNNGDLTLGTVSTGEGTLTLNGASSRDRATTLIAGTLLLGNDTALGLSTTRLTVTGGGSKVALGSSGGARSIANLMTVNSDLEFVGSDQLTFSGGFALNNKKLTVNNGNKVVISHANGIGGTGGFSVGNGTGTLVIAGSNANTNTGPVTIDGKLQLGNAGATGALNASSAVTLNATGELSFDRTDAALNVANVISGAGALRQKGSGTTTLSGDNSGFTGGTNVDAGTLAVAHGNALGGATGGVVSIANGATLGTSVALTFSNNVTNNGTIDSRGNAVVFAAGKTLDGSGAFTGGGSFTVNGALSHGSHPGLTTIDSTALTFGSASTTSWKLASFTDNGTGTAGGDWDAFSVQGSGSVSILSGAGLQIGLDGIVFDGSQSYWQTSHSYSVFNASVTGSFTLSGNVFADAYGTGVFSVTGGDLLYTFTPAAIPEASTSAFAVLAGAAVIFSRTRRRSRDAR